MDFFIIAGMCNLATNVGFNVILDPMEGGGEYLRPPLGYATGIHVTECISYYWIVIHSVRFVRIEVGGWEIGIPGKDEKANISGGDDKTSKGEIPHPPCQIEHWTYSPHQSRLVSLIKWGIRWRFDKSVNDIFLQIEPGNKNACFANGFTTTVVSVGPPRT